MTSQRRLAILADGHLDFHHGKTATSILRYRPEEVVAVIDRDHAGQTVDEVLAIAPGVPIVADIEATLPYAPSALLIGIAPRGGGLPADFRRQIVFALEHGLDVVSGLHSMLGEDPEFVSAAHRGGSSIYDVRRPPEGLEVATLQPRRTGSRTITLVGSDCAVGKMTAALEMVAAGRRLGLSCAFVATGQTGIMLEGSGIAIDRVIGDFMAGATEQMVVDASHQADWVVVEGQGSLLHPGYSGVTLALLHGSSPDAMVLVHQAGQTHIDEYDVPIPPLEQVVRLYEDAAGWIKPAAVVAIALNTRGLSEDEVSRAVEEARERTGLPVADPIRHGGEPLIRAVLGAFGEGGTDGERDPSHLAGHVRRLSQ